MPLRDLAPHLEDEIEDADNETFDLYSNDVGSQNLGFVDAAAQTVEVSLAGRDVTILQSPGVLASTRAGGTTGAVLWKVTPLFANWLASPSNPLFTTILTPSSTVLELGCGISPLNALAIAPRIANYVLSDQNYVQKLLSQNILANQSSSSAPSASRGSNKRRLGKTVTPPPPQNMIFRALDWEQDQVSPELAEPASSYFDAVVATDCVYNYALVDPFVQTCVDLRNHEVFRAWLGAFMRRFRVWRLRGDVLPGLGAADGFVVHVGVLKSGK
ncbi:hypothetical protein E4U49_006238 [Claviceps purpurea]|nr:hypothetical protein E4U49_006238 [Claviceps purpurea]KAG6303243.1 hypothetical protein E4U45_002291 [Claviceps purpurea]